LTHEQVAFAKSLSAVVDRHGESCAPTASDALWRDLADVGVLGLCAPGVGATPLDLVAGMEALGGRGCPGPLVATTAAARLLTGPDLDAIVSGERRVTITDGRLVPWGFEADVVIEFATDGAWLVAADDLEPVTTLSREPWARARVRRLRRLGDGEAPLSLAQVALAAYMLGAAIELIARVTDHARARVQFRRPIGDFQAVAHPLARSSAELRATVDLVRLVARGQMAVREANAARVEAARVSAVAGDRVHQAFGAVGFASETGIAAMTTRIRQWAALPLVADERARSSN